MMIFTSRKFWITLIALLIIILQSFFPSFAINQDLMVDSIIIVATYIVALELGKDGSGNRLLSMFKSRRFWVSFISIIILLIQIFVPSFKIDQELMTAYLLVVVPFILSLSLDKKVDGNKWLVMLKDKKFITACVGIIMVILGSLNVSLPLGLTQDQIIQATVAFGGYILSLGLKNKLAV